MTRSLIGAVHRQYNKPWLGGLVLDLCDLHPISIKKKLPDTSIKSRFLVSFGRIDMSENIAEAGASIKSDVDMGTWLEWLLHIMVWP